MRLPPTAGRDLSFSTRNSLLGKPRDRDAIELSIVSHRLAVATTKSNGVPNRSSGRRKAPNQQVPTKATSHTATSLPGPQIKQKNGRSLERVRWPIRTRSTGVLEQCQRTARVRSSHLWIRQRLNHAQNILRNSETEDSRWLFRGPARTDSDTIDGVLSRQRTAPSPYPSSSALVLALAVMTVREEFPQDLPHARQWRFTFPR